jgi:Tat protein translocase TatB subunit
MANLGSGEILVVLLLALVVLGPERLPVVARKIGNFMRYAKEMTSGLQEEVRKAVDLDPVHATVDAIRAPIPPAAPAPTTEPVAATTPAEPAHTPILDEDRAFQPQ